MRSHDESKLQVAAVKWLRYMYPRVRVFSVPNGGTRQKREAAILKAEGALAGVSDLFLAAPRGQWAGLFIEIKTEKGTLQDTQKEFLEYSDRVGYAVAVVRSLDDFMELVTAYLNEEYKRDLPIRPIQETQKLIRKWISNKTSPTT
jgi:hypothetical protein